MAYYPNYQQPQHFEYSQPSVLFAYVNGYEGAKAYTMPFGAMACLMDINEQVFYWKVSNNMGQCSISKHPFTTETVEVKQEKKPLTEDDVKNMIAEAVQGLQSQTKTKKSEV